MTNDAEHLFFYVFFNIFLTEHLFIYCIGHSRIFFDEMSVHLFAYFLNNLFLYYYYYWIIRVYIMDISHLSHLCFVNFFLQSVARLIFVSVPTKSKMFEEQTFLILMMNNWFF